MSMAMAGNSSSNLDRVQERQINLHLSGFDDELGLGRRNHPVGEDHLSGPSGRFWLNIISYSLVGHIVDTDKDAHIKFLGGSQFGVTLSEEMTCIRS